MGMPCSVCASPHRRAVDADLVKGESARAIGLKFKLGERAIQRHRQAHLSPALAAVEARRTEAGAGSLADRMGAMVAKASALIDRLEAEGATGMQLAAMREFRGQVETLAKLTGAIDASPKVAVNILTSSEVQSLVTVLLKALEPYEAARVAAAQALQVLDVEATA